MACTFDDTAASICVRVKMPQLLPHTHPEAIRRTWADGLTTTIEAATPAQLAWLGTWIADPARADALDALARRGAGRATVGALLATVDA